MEEDNSMRHIFGEKWNILSSLKLNKEFINILTGIFIFAVNLFNIFIYLFLILIDIERKLEITKVI